MKYNAVNSLSRYPADIQRDDCVINRSYVVSLFEPKATNISLFGAKAGNLAKAAQLGFNVPDGLAIARGCRDNEFALLAQEIFEEILPSGTVYSSAITARSSAIVVHSSAINEVLFPPVAVHSSVINEELLPPVAEHAPAIAVRSSAIAARSSTCCAVRSSATKEDSINTAFAGQFETCLGIRSTADLKSAFKTVKHSGSTDIFKRNNGDATRPEQIAVLIQRMVNATRAGVAFSRDPNSGEQKVIIESNYGLGKSVVDGEVTPDSIVCFNDGKLEKYVGRKSIQYILTDDGVLKIDTPPADAQKCSLTDGEIKAIISLTKKVEHDLGFAADIEWAIDADGFLWLLQARPITTLKEGFDVTASNCTAAPGGGNL